VNDLSEASFLPPQGLSPAEEPTPARLVSVPSPQQRGRYALAYWPAALRSLLSPHRIDPSAARWSYPARFQPRPDEHARWCEAFGLDAAAAAGAPFLFSQATGTLLYMRLFAGLGLNFRHLLHLRHRATHRPAPKAAQLGSQLVLARVAAVNSLDARKDVVHIACTVSSEDGLVLLHVQDDFIVRGYRPGQLAALARHPAPQFEALQHPAPRWAPGTAPWQASIDIPADLGQRYGQLSGDANPVHTTPWAAWLFGHPKPFLRGRATRSMIVGHLAQSGWQVCRLDLHFAGRCPAASPCCCRTTASVSSWPMPAARSCWPAADSRRRGPEAAVASARQQPLVRKQLGHRLALADRMHGTAPLSVSTCCPARVQ
jgi:hypothetical protein